MANNYDDLYEAAGRKYDVDPLLIKAHAIHETKENPAMTGADGEWGMMQFMPGTAAQVGLSKADAYKPATAIDAAAKFIRMNLDKNTDAQGNTDVGAAVRRYNGSGPATIPYEASIRAIHARLKSEPQAAQSVAAPDAFGQTLTAQAPDAFGDTLTKQAPAAASSQAPDAFADTLTAPASPEAQTQQAMIADSRPMAWIGNGLMRGVHQATDVPAEALARGADYLANKLGFQTTQGQQTAAGDQAFNSAYDANPANKGTGPAAARMAGNMAVTIPAAMGVGKVIAPLASLAGPLAPVASGAAQGAAVNGMTGEDVNIGAMIGGALGGAGAVIGKGINKLMISKDPGVAAAVNDYGIPLRAGQVTDNKFVRYLDSQVGNLPFSGQEASNAAQRAAVNKAVAGSFGENATKITPQVMQNAKDRIGGVMNDIEARTTIQADPQLLHDLSAIETSAQKTPSIYNDVRPHITDILETAAANGGTIPGKAYQALVGHNSDLATAAQSGQGVVKNYASQIRDALENAMQRYAADGDAQAYSNARLQYKNMMTVAPLVNKGVPGDINPLLLQGAANRSFKNNAFRGAGDLGEIGDIAQTYLRAPPDSGTATRQLINQTFYGDVKGIGKNMLGATAGRAAAAITGSNPLTGPRIAAGIPGGIPASILLRNALNPDQSR